MKKEKISFIERCVYFFELRAYERRIESILQEKDYRISKLEGKLVDSVYGTDDPVRMHEIKEEAEYLKNREDFNFDELLSYSKR